MKEGEAQPPLPPLTARHWSRWYVAIIDFHSQKEALLSKPQPKLNEINIILTYIEDKLKLNPTKLYPERPSENRFNQLHFSGEPARCTVDGSTSPQFTLSGCAAFFIYFYLTGFRCVRTFSRHWLLLKSGSNVSNVSTHIFTWNVNFPGLVCLCLDEPATKGVHPVWRLRRSPALPARPGGPTLPSWVCLRGWWTFTGSPL